MDAYEFPKLIPTTAGRGEEEGTSMGASAVPFGREPAAMASKCSCFLEKIRWV